MTEMQLTQRTQRAEAASDERLVALAARGDDDAMNALLERHARTACAYAYAIVHHAADAEDVAQTALAQIAFELRTRWRGAAFKPCLYACVHSAAVNLLKQSAARKRAEQQSPAYSREGAIMSDDPIERRETTVVLKEELAALPEQTASLLAMFHLEERPVAEVAHEFGLSVDACKQRLSRGREELRERLKRRGVFVASASMLSMRLEDVFKTAAGQAQAVNTNRLAQAANVASRTLPTSAASPLSSQPRSQALRAMPRWMMAASLLLCVGLGVITSVLLARAMSGNDASQTGGAGASATGLKLRGANNADQTAVVANRSNAAAAMNDAGDAVVNGQPAVSRWQTPAFIQKSYAPVSISAAGNHVAVLAVDKESSAPALVLLTSADGGRTWPRSINLSSYSSGAVSIDADGVCEIAAMRLPSEVLEAFKYPWEERQKRGLDINIVDYNRLDRLIVAADGKTALQNAVWDMPARQPFHSAPRTKAANLQDNPALLPTREATWIFAKSNATIVAAIVRGTQTTPVSVETKGWPGGGDSPVAWALDERTAGFMMAHEKQIVAYSTSDEGKTWSTTTVLTAPAPGADSQQTFTNAEPIAIARDGKRLALLVRTMLPGANSTKVPARLDRFEQYMIVLSEDLGQTWSEAVAVSERRRSKGHMDGSYGVTIAGGRIYVCHESYQMDDADSFSRVLASDDGGRTWYDHHAFDALKTKVLFPTIASTGDAIHVAVFKQFDVQNVAKHGCLVIRSFTAGTWPTEKMPDWFKEDAAPAMTKEDF